MKHGYKSIKDSVRHYPLLLTSYPVKLQKEIDKLLPYRTGIEIEINTYLTVNGHNLFSSVSFLEKVVFEPQEIKFRIPSGIKGIICLYEICEILKKEYKLNPKSGIHYHIDCLDIERFNQFTFFHLNKDNSWVLNTLKSWNYTGDYNEWEIGSLKNTVISFRDWHNTIEFRLGEMTFDYNLMLKRIIHAQNITKKLKNDYKKSLISL